MSRVGAALRGLWLFLSTLAGIGMAISAAAMAIVLPVGMLIGARDGELAQKWPLFHFLTVLWLSLIAFLNMMYFFRRLKHDNRDLYYVATEGWPVYAYIMSSRSAYRLLHRWVARIANDHGIEGVAGLRSHATVTRYLNMACLYGWLSLILAALGIGVFLEFTGAR